MPDAEDDGFDPRTKKGERANRQTEICDTLLHALLRASMMSFAHRRDISQSVRQDKPKIRVVAALIEREGRYLITKRRASAVLPLLWEFPGGRVEDGETDAEALCREVMERLGVHARVGMLISFVDHEYENYRVGLHLYQCELEEGELRPIGVADARFVSSAEFEHYEFTPADELSVARLLGLGRDGRPC